MTKEFARIMKRRMRMSKAAYAALIFLVVYWLFLAAGVIKFGF
jgi:hypothetical protein